MISNKVLATIFIITLNMQRAASSSSGGTQGSSPSGESTPLVRKQRPALKTSEVLVDTTNDVSPVKVQGGSAGDVEISQEQPVPQRKNGPGFFETLMSRGRYDRMCYFARRIRNDKFLKRICPLVKTLEQYNGIVGYLKRHKMVASFYMHGDIEVVKRAIVESSVYGEYSYDEGGNLEAALLLALEKDNHDRFMELLDIRMGITAEKDELVKQQEKVTSFGLFVYYFLYHLAPWENGLALRRFFILCGDEIRTKHRDILDTLCEKLVRHLRGWLDKPKAESLLMDLIGQPSLLSPVAFTRDFLSRDTDGLRSAFIKYGWREAIQEGLKQECDGGGEALWLVMQREKPEQFPGEFPVTEKALAAALKHIPTKQQKEDEWIKKYEEWIKENALILYNELKPHDDIFNLLPDVLWSIISGYAVTLVDKEDSTILQK